MNMVKHILFLLIFTFYCSLSYGNNQHKLDSLIRQFNFNAPDSIRWPILEEINNILTELDDDTIFVIWNNLIDYCALNNYEKGIGYCKYNQAKRLRKDGEYIKGLHLFQEALNVYTQTNDSVGMAQVHNSLGILYNRIAKYELSNTHYFESARIYSKLKDTVKVGWIYLNLGGVLEIQDSLELAEYYLKESEKILTAHNEPNILNCYINLGLLYNKQYKKEDAFYYLKKGYELSKTVGDVRDKFMSPYLLGEFLFKHNKSGEAESYLMEARQLYEEPQNQKIIGVSVLSDFTYLLSQYYEQKAEYKMALDYLNQHVRFDNESKTKQSRFEYEFGQLERQRDEEQKEAQKIKKRREVVIAFTLSGLVLTLLLLWFVYRNYKHKKRANKLLTEMDELKTKLYSNISHELRTPLTLILGPLEQILSSEEKNKATNRQIKLMRKNANSILTLVNQMLDLSKIDAKSLKLELSEADIIKFIKVLFAGFASLAEQKNISFHRYLPPDKKIRFFDASKLEKIINNLISNAIKFTQEGGQIFCFASFPGQNILELIVQDTGKGIPSNELGKIFDRFHQVTGDNTISNVGTGIGLSLTKELVELLHGKINVESVVGEGTKFKIQIPLGKEHLKKDEYMIVPAGDSAMPVAEIDEDLKQKQELCENNLKNKGENMPHVLVVDDHPEISDFIKENLVNCYSVDTAENGVMGFNKAVENIPDLIISDLMMPEMDGIEMSRKLKSDERTSHIPIIILSARSKVEERLEGLETGADAFLAKPFSMKELTIRIRKLIEQRNKLRERFTKNLSLEPRDISVSSADEKFIHRAMEIIEDNISNSEFEVRQFQEEMLMSRMQLFRKIKAITNQTPGEFIRTIRLKRAARLMDQNFGNIAQITYEVGFNNPSYFAKCFKELFGQLPSEYMKKE